MESMLVPLWSHIRASFSFMDTCTSTSGGQGSGLPCHPRLLHAAPCLLT